MTRLFGLTPDEVRVRFGDDVIRTMLVALLRFGERIDVFYNWARVGPGAVLGYVRGANVVGAETCRAPWNDCFCHFETQQSRDIC